MLGKRTFALGLILAIAAGFGCSNKSNEAKTTVPIAWRSPEFVDASYDDFFVIAIASTEERRRTMENAMVQALEEKGVDAVPSYSMFPDGEKLDKAKLLASLKAQDFDAVLVTRLLHIDVAEEYVEGTTRYEPTSNADFYMWDYDQQYQEIHEPGYIKESKTYNVETTLYSAQQGDKVGYIVSETVDPDTVEQVMGSVARTAAASLEAAKLIR